MSEGAAGSGRMASRSAAGDRNPWIIAIVVSIATFMTVLDTAIANVALRNIAGSLAAGVDESTWVVTTYLVAGAVIIPTSGWLSSVIGRKRFYMLCVAVFTASSLLCAMAPNLGALIFFRVLQGLGGGGMAPSEQAILADTFPPEKRPQAFALYGIAIIVAPTVGPTIGGWLTDNFSWHWIFLINVPIGLGSLALVQWLVVEPEVLERERRARIATGLNFDWLGFACVSLWLGCLEIVLDKGQREDWFASDFIVTFSILSVVGFLCFVPWELAHKDPLVDVRLVLTRQFGMSFAVMMAVGALLFGTTQILPQLLQVNFSYTATLSGLALMPGGLVMLVLMPISGQVSGRVQPKYLMAVALAVLAYSMWHMTSLAPGADFSYFVWARILQMMALPFLFIPIQTAAYDGLAPEKTNQASALINVARNLGGSIGVSVANSLLAQRQQFHQVRLVEHIEPSSLSYQEAIRRASEYFAAQGSAPPDAAHQALGWIGYLVQTQASIMSYVDLFWLWAIFAIAMIPLALLLRPVTQHGGAAAVH